MRRQQAKAARRQAAGRPSAREINIPLPLRGILYQARGAQVSNLFAAELVNWRSNGVSMVTRPGLGWEGAASTVLQRMPYEFSGAPRYIELRPTQAVCGTATLDRLFTGTAMSAAISSNVVIVDGFGDPVRYDGTAFYTSIFTTTTGVLPRTFNGAIAHQDRLFFWNTDEPDFYYGDVGAVQGELVYFPLSRLGNITGKIIAMRSLTIDAGNDINDVLAIFMSTGQIVLYQGLNPSDPDDWRQMGRVQAAPPIGRDSFTSVGSDVWMLTPNGVVSVGESLRSSSLALVSELSTPIAEEVKALVESDPAAVWELFTARDGSMIVINRRKGIRARQFIFYPLSKSWATGSAAVRSFHNLGTQPQATGFDGRLGSFSTENGEELITARWQSSWFETGQAASLCWVKPTIRAKGPLTVRLVVLSDRRDTLADIAEAEQTLFMEPEGDDGGTITLDDEFSSDAEGSSFQITLEVTATWAEIISMKAALE